MSKAIDTLTIAREELAEGFKAGETMTCQCCFQTVKRYHRKLNSNMASSLLIIYKAAGHRPNAWVDVYKTVGNHEPIKKREFAKLVYWGFLEQRVNTDTKKKHSGVWAVTPDGANFAEGRTTTASHAWIYNGEVLGLDYTKTIGIQDALGDHFDYAELMGTDKS